MSYYLQIDGVLAEQVASNKGWGDFGRWTETLDDEHGEVKQLYNAGWCDEPEALTAQLKEAILKTPPKDADTLKVAKGLLDAMGDEANKTVVSITDGIGP